MSGDGDNYLQLLLQDHPCSAKGNNNLWLAVLVAVLHFKLSVVDRAGDMVVLRQYV